MYNFIFILIKFLCTVSLVKLSTSSSLNLHLIVIIGSKLISKNEIKKKKK